MIFLYMILINTKFVHFFIINIMSEKETKGLEGTKEGEE